MDLWERHSPQQSHQTVSDRRGIDVASKAKGLGGLRQVRSDPVLPRIDSSKKLHMMDAVDRAMADDGSAPSHARRRLRSDSYMAKAAPSSLMPPGRLEEVSGEVLASIEGIRSSMEHFQGRRSADQDAHREQDPDAFEDLQQRLACYRFLAEGLLAFASIEFLGARGYARRIEPPPPPLAMDPSLRGKAREFLAAEEAASLTV
eukprot:Skav212663  [mRNA]  locus=scaffold1227:430207:447647:+ [translate_table: standard]